MSFTGRVDLRGVGYTLFNMPIPVINKTQGNLAFALGQDFVFQLNASNYPTSWAVEARQVMPHGVVFAPLTGVISGAATTPGIWNLTFTASNADGASAPQTFTFGFFETGSREISKKVLINTETWVVTLLDPAPARAASTGVSALAASAGQARFGDDITFRLAFTDGTQLSTATPGPTSTVKTVETTGTKTVETTTANVSGSATAVVEYTPRLVSARFSMKGDDTLPPFFVTDAAAFKRSVEVSGGQYVTTFFLYASMESPELGAFLADYESEAGTEVNVMCEFELEFERPARASGPLTNRVTTQAFFLRVRRDMAR